MRKRKRFWPLTYIVITLVIWAMLLELRIFSVESIMMSSSCIANLSCVCSWRSGKFVLDCPNANLEKVPKNHYYDSLLEKAGDNQMPTLNRDIQLLNLTNNLIVGLESDEFYEKKFINLQKIFLNHNKISYVHHRAFNKLTGLVELDLSYNIISELESDVKTKDQQTVIDNNTRTRRIEEEEDENGNGKVTTFLNDLIHLRTLNLANNKLTSLKGSPFVALSQLRQLYLSRNRIDFISVLAFKGLNQLNVLHINGNKLTYLSGNIITKLPQLHSIRLAENPWFCDCKLRNLIRRLAFKSSFGNSPKPSNLNQTSSMILTINSLISSSGHLLEDEPECESSSWYQLNSNSWKRMDQLGSGSEQSNQETRWNMEHKKGTSLWTNMTIRQFQCPPKLARPHRDSRLMLELDPNISMDEPSSEELNEQANKLSIEARQRSSSSSSSLSVPEATKQTKMFMNSYERNNDNNASDGRSNRVASSLSLSLATVDSDQAILTNNNNSNSVRPTNPEQASDNEQEREDQRAMFGYGPESSQRKLSASQVYRLKDKRQSISKPIDLTCSIELSDELDLELAQIEWFLEATIRNENQEESNERVSAIRRSLWRSSDVRLQHNKTTTTTTPIVNGQLEAGKRFQRSAMKKTIVSSGGRKGRLDETNNFIPSITVIDYVTRLDDSANDSIGHKDKTTSSKMARVVHLILLDSPKLRSYVSIHDRKDEKNSNEPIGLLFMCRITNQVGRLDFIQPIILESDDQSTSKTNHVPNSGQPSIPIALSHQMNLTALQGSNAGIAFSGQGLALDQARMLLAQEIEKDSSNKHISGPLFIPLQVPDWLVSELQVIEQSERNEAQKSPSTLNLTNSRNTDISTRPAIRQIETRMFLDSPSILSTARSHPSEESIGLLRSIARNLISAYTLGLPYSYEQQEFDLILDDSSDMSNNSHMSTAERNNNWFAKFRESNIWKGDISSWWKKRFKDSWGRFDIAYMSLFLALFLGILLGCLLTKIIILYFQSGSRSKKDVTEELSSKKEHIQAKCNSSQSPPSSLDHQVVSSSPWSLNQPEAVDRIDSLTAIRAEETTNTGGSGSSTTTGSQRALIKGPLRHQGHVYEQQNDPSLILGSSSLSRNNSDNLSDNRFMKATTSQTMNRHRLQHNPSMSSFKNSVFVDPTLTPQMESMNIHHQVSPPLTHLDFEHRNQQQPRSWLRQSGPDETMQILPTRSSSHYMLLEPLQVPIYTQGPYQGVDANLTLNRRSNARDKVYPSISIPIGGVANINAQQRQIETQGSYLRDLNFRDQNQFNENSTYIENNMGMIYNGQSTIESALDLLRSTVDVCIPE